MALLTEDHSWVEQQVKKGKLTREQARNHQKRNMLTQCLGIEEGVDPFEQVGKSLKHLILIYMEFCLV